MSVRLGLLLTVSLASVAALAVSFLATPLDTQRHRFTCCLLMFGLPVLSSWLIFNDI